MNPPFQAYFLSRCLLHSFDRMSSRVGYIVGWIVRCGIEASPRRHMSSFFHVALMNPDGKRNTKTSRCFGGSKEVEKQNACRQWRALSGVHPPTQELVLRHQQLALAVVGQLSQKHSGVTSKTQDPKAPLFRRCQPGCRRVGGQCAKQEGLRHVELEYAASMLSCPARQLAWPLPIAIPRLPCFLSCHRRPAAIEGHRWYHAHLAW